MLIEDLKQIIYNSNQTELTPELAKDTHRKRVKLFLDIKKRLEILQHIEADYKINLLERDGEIKAVSLSEKRANAPP